MVSIKESYCRFPRGRARVCPYQLEEQTLSLCMVCKVREITSQQDLIIKQNKAVITILNQIRDLLKEGKDVEAASRLNGTKTVNSQKWGRERC